MALHEASRQGIPYPFEYEQRSFHYLLQTQVWRTRGLPKYHPAAPSRSSKVGDMALRGHMIAT